MTSVEEPSSMDIGSSSLPTSETPTTSIEEGVSQASTPSVSEDVPHITSSSSSSSEELRNETSEISSQPSLMGSGNNIPSTKGLKRSRGAEVKPIQPEQTETPLGKRVRKPTPLFADYQKEKAAKSPSVGITGSPSPSVSLEALPITPTTTTTTTTATTPLDANGVLVPQLPPVNMVPGSAAEPGLPGQPVPARDVLLTPEQARERNRKLPKGYAYVPEVEVLNPPAALDAQPVSGKRERKKINYAEVSKAKEATTGEAGSAPSTTTATTTTTPTISGVASPVAVGIVPSPSPSATRRGKKEKSEAKASKSEKKKSKKSAKKEKNQRKKELQNKLSQLDTQLLHLSELEREMELGTTSAGPVPKEEQKTKKRRNSKATDTTPISDSKKRRKGSPSRSKKNRSPSPSPPPTTAARPQRSSRKKLAYEPDEAELSPALKECQKVLIAVMEHQHAWPFNQAVDPVALNIPDYFRIIKHPMDLGTVKSQLEAGYYANPEEFAQDVRLVWSNAQTFNPPEHDVYIMSKILSQYFESKYKRIADKQKKDREREREKAKEAKAHRHQHHAPKVQAQPQPDPVQQLAMAGVFPEIINELRKSMDAVREEIRKIKKSKEKRPPPKRQINIKAKFDENRPMSKDEKRALSIAINDLASQHLGMVVQIIHERMPALAKNAASDEIEIDIDNLDTPTLRHLEKYVRSCNQPYASQQRGPRANARKPGPAPQQLQSPVAPPSHPTNRVQQAEQTETGTAKRIQQVEKRLLEIQRQTQQYTKGVPRPGGRGKEEEDVVIDDEDQGKSYPPVVIEKDKAAESSSDDSSDESDSSSDSDSDSDSSDTDSDSDSSSETESEPEKKSKRKEGKSESNAHHHHTHTQQIKKPSSSSSIPTATTITSTSTTSSAVPLLPLVASLTEPKSKPASSTSSSDDKVVFKIEPMQLELGSPPIVTHEPVASLASLAAPQQPAKEVVIRNADAWANLDEDDEDDKKSTETVSLWSEFKSKDEQQKQKEREREEQEQRLRREAEEQEEERRREEERKKREEEEAIAERLLKEKEAEEAARREREARRMAERLEREKRVGRATTSINDQTEIMASFEQQVSKTNMNDILRSVGVGSPPGTGGETTNGGGSEGSSASSV